MKNCGAGGKHSKVITGKFASGGLVDQTKKQRLWDMNDSGKGQLNASSSTYENNRAVRNQVVGMKRSQDELMSIGNRTEADDKPVRRSQAGKNGH